MKKSIFLILFFGFSGIEGSQGSARKYTILPLEVAESSRCCMPVIESSNSIAQINFSSPYFGRTDSMSPRLATPRTRLTTPSPLMTQNPIVETPTRFSAQTPMSPQALSPRQRSNSSLTISLEDGGAQARRNCVDFTDFCCNTLGSVDSELFTYIVAQNDSELIRLITPVVSQSPVFAQKFADVLRSASK